MNETITYYNQNAEEYFDKTVNVSMQELYDQFEVYLKPGDKILDLGCGSGRDSKYFLSKGYDVISVDGSKAMYNLAGAYIGREVRNITFEKINYDNEFDVVWAYASLVHVYFNSSPLRFYSLSNDLEELHNIFENKGFVNSSGFFDYLSSIYRRYQIALEHFITRPFRHKRDFYNPKVLWNFLKLKTFDSVDQMMSKFIPDKDLQQMLSFQTLYIGVSPKKGPSLYNIIPMIELLYGV